MRYIAAVADELGLAGWLHSTPVAIPLYEKYGFRVIEFGQRRAVLPEGERDAEGREVDTAYREAWRAIEERMGPVPHIQIWRPKGGLYVPGVTRKPWEE